MLTIADLKDYQRYTLNYIKSTPKCGVFLQMGLGKTVSTLTAISELIANGEVDNVLVIGPLQVVNTVWNCEHMRWEHLQHLKVKTCSGNKHERVKYLSEDADIHTINVENVNWLVCAMDWKWDMLVIDESSMFKSHKTLRFKSLKPISKLIPRVVLLTGTPAPNNSKDLWSQSYLLDGGERLGKSFFEFSNRFYYATGYKGYDLIPKPGAQAEIVNKISDICVSMKSLDHLELPPCVVKTENVLLPKSVMTSYRRLEKDLILNLDESAEVDVGSAAALSNKLLQLCNGFIYDENGDAHVLHDRKIKALESMVDNDSDENFLVAYNFKSDLTALKSAFPEAVVLSKSGLEIEMWNRGEIKMLLAHPASAGHGVNLQFGGSILVWFGLTWSLERYQQFNARLNRPGQKKTVTIAHIVAKDCIDEDVVNALNSKAENQEEVIRRLKITLKSKIN